MEFPSSQADSPTTLRGIAGPSRARLEARQQRNSTLKPYDRRVAGSTDSLRVGGARVRNDSTVSAFSSKSSINKLGSKGSGEAAKTSGGGGGLLSGLRDAIFSRPFSWFGGNTKSQNSSSAGLPSHAQQSAAQRLAASVRMNGQDDIESHRDSIAGKPKIIAPPPPSASQSLTQPSTSASQQTPFTPARSPSPAISSASAIIQSHGRQRLSVGPTPQSLRFGGSTLGTPGYRKSGSIRPDDGSSVSGIAASQSNPTYAFGFGSERRIAGLSTAASSHSVISPSPLASSSYNVLPSRSPFAMSRNSYAGTSTGGSVLGIERSPRYGGSVLGTPSRSRPVSMFGGEMSRSRAGSVADSRMSNSSQTPKRRDWSSLKLAPPKVDFSEGEELMQAYMAMRDGATANQGSVHPALQSGPDTLMMEFGAGSMPARYDEGSLKRGMSMSIDGDENMSDIAPRKRQKQMVWDHELGFISKEDLRARQITKVVPKNEAERLLNALEGMRSPMPGTELHRRESSRSSTPSRQMMTVPVPLPVPERSGLDGGKGRKKLEDLTKTVSPYSRLLKQRSKLSQSMEVDESKGLRSRLRKPISGGRGEASPRKGKKMDDDDQRSDESMNAGEEEEEEEEEDEQEEESDEEEEKNGDEEEDESGEEEVVEPPRKKKPGVTVTNEKEEERKTLRSGKVLPPTTTPKKSGIALTPLSPTQLNSIPQSTSKPFSKARLEISVSGTSAANRQRATHQSQQQPIVEVKAAPLPSGNGNFKVLSGSTEMRSERSRSMLRQGAEKTHRTHGRSGRIALDDDDDDEDEEDLPGSEELDKIKLPSNLFPQGFTFSGSSTPSWGNGSQPLSASNSSLKALPAPSDNPEKQQQLKEVDTSEANKGEGASSNSLLSRLGGFAPEPATSSTPSIKPSIPSFSFSVPSSASETAAPATKPLFSFQTTTPNPSSGASTTTSAPNFFSMSIPSTGEAKLPVTTPSETKNDGPVPNFFASSLAKSNPTQSTEPIKSFSFGNGSTSKPDSASNASSSPFTFGAPASSTPATDKPASSPAATSFSFAPKQSDEASSKNAQSAPLTFQGFGNPTKESGQVTTSAFGGFGMPANQAEGTPKTAPSFSFASPSTSATSAATGTPTFSGFSTDSSKKRGADEDQEPPAKKANGFNPSPSFSFGGSGSTAPPASNSDGGFSFGTPKPNNDSTNSNKSELSFSTPFKSKTEGDGESKASTSSTGGFSFGGSNSGASFGVKATDSMDTSPVSLNVKGSSSTPTSNNLFGGPSSSNTAAKPSFSFGGPIVSTSSATASTTTPTSSQGSFSFGSSAPVKSDAPHNSSTSFSFGGQSNSSSNSNMFGQPSPSIATSNAFGSSSINAPTDGGFGSANNGNSGFGSNTNTANNSRQGSPAPFTFGSSNITSNAAPSSATPSMGGFASGFGSNTAQSQPPTSSFTFGTPSNGVGGIPNPSNAGSAGGGFSFSMPATGASNPSNSFMSSAASPAPPSSPFTFGSGGNGNNTPPPQTAPSSGFSFGMSSPAAPTLPQSPGGGNLFNMGAPPPAGSGNRPVRGMPSRKKR